VKKSPKKKQPAFESVTHVTTASISSDKPPTSVLKPGVTSSNDMVVITGMSGSGKGSVLRAFEDLGYFCVDNMPVDLIPTFAELSEQTASLAKAALVVDVREGEGLKKLPAILKKLKRELRVSVVFLEASDEALVRRYSETRRPHPMLKDRPVREAIIAEHKMLSKVRSIADVVVDTTRFNVHELRAFIVDRFQGKEGARPLLVACTSFGYRNGVPADSDLVFDVRFLPNPNYIPQFRHLTGRHPQVAKYIKSFPQTTEFIRRITELLVYLIPHYIREGKSYLTIAFGCTGGQHRSVAMADAIRKNLAAAGFSAKVLHRDSPS
jgi:UPF0042 nucleotide-binding protein